MFRAESVPHPAKAAQPDPLLIGTPRVYSLWPGALSIRAEGDTQAVGLKDAMKKIPPNLRRGNAKRRCALCRSYDGKLQCLRFGARVRPTELCDSFSEKKG